MGCWESNLLCHQDTCQRSVQRVLLAFPSSRPLLLKPSYCELSNRAGKTRHRRGLPHPLKALPLLGGGQTQGSRASAWTPGLLSGGGPPRRPTPPGPLLVQWQVRCEPGVQEGLGGCPVGSPVLPTEEPHTCCSFPEQRTHLLKSRAIEPMMTPSVNEPLASATVWEADRPCQGGYTSSRVEGTQFWALSD